jgi:hypothetical protein
MAGSRLFDNSKKTMAAAGAFALTQLPSTEAVSMSGIIAAAKMHPEATAVLTGTAFAFGILTACLTCCCVAKCKQKRENKEDIELRERLNASDPQPTSTGSNAYGRL